MSVILHERYFFSGDNVENGTVHHICRLYVGTQAFVDTESPTRVRAISVVASSRSGSRFQILTLVTNGKMMDNSALSFGRVNTTSQPR
ncbi:hypothetical protein TNCV_3296181 [Trichonephila clavipes]|uniref:Uncharacterized protein n=1 Tax=Trichonephila clavipes TaxID=2585209 RepID=A0A8X6SXR1_TRICX|nr:hypothetical protein TNCV_3296181 [Trichonephila clavipes]